ncbi:hypothetical protein C0J52_05880 [Blattella germanica]|nr:hypothetical protein C0J52_05880 [Blattella germanica]
MMLGLLTFIGVLFLIIVLCVTKCFRKCWPDRRQSADLPAITPLKFTDFLDSYYYLNPFGRFDDFYYDLNRNSPAVN